MALEATMICLDNSEWMRNGDYRGSRFAAQYDAATIICGAKMEANQISTVGVLAMAGKGVRVLVTPINDLSQVLASLHGLQIGGESNLTLAIQVAQLVLKNRQIKQQQQRIIVFVGSPVMDDKNVLEAIGKKLKKNNVALDVIDFGESEDEKPKKLEALVAVVNNDGNSHIIHVPPGEGSLSDIMLRSSILAEDSQSSTSNGDTVMFDAEPEPTPFTEDKRNLRMVEEDQPLQLVHLMSIEDGNKFILCAASAEPSEGVTYEFELEMSDLEEKTGTQSDLPAVDLYIIGWNKAKKQRKKHKKKQQKKHKKKHEKKEDEPEDGKSQ